MLNRHILLGAAITILGAVPMLGARQTFLPGPSFIPDATIKGSSLAGWHTEGASKWSLNNGDLTGTPGPGGAGGWLVMDHSYQDMALFTKFMCSGGCETGILFRIEKTADGGMKGTYAQFSGSDVVTYFDVTTDANGKITSRTPLRRGGGKMRIAPPPNPNPPARTAHYVPNPYSPYVQTPGVSYPYMKPDSNLYPDQ